MKVTFALDVSPDKAHVLYRIRAAYIHSPLDIRNLYYRQWLERDLPRALAKRTIKSMLAEIVSAAGGSGALEAEQFLDSRSVEDALSQHPE